jgi:hypothetical protein
VRGVAIGRNICQPQPAAVAALGIIIHGNGTVDGRYASWAKGDRHKLGVAPWADTARHGCAGDPDRRVRLDGWSVAHHSTSANPR